MSHKSTRQEQKARLRADIQIGEARRVLVTAWHPASGYDAHRAKELLESTVATDVGMFRGQWGAKAAPATVIYTREIRTETIVTYESIKTEQTKQVTL